MIRDIQILIAEDDPCSRMIARVIMECAADIRVVAEAADGQEAVDHAELVMPDIILMDLNMPTMDGVEASRRILARRRQIRIVAYTSLEADDLMVLDAVRAGARGYLQKPASPDELVQVVRNVHGGGFSLPAGLARELPGVPKAC